MSNRITRFTRVSTLAPMRLTNRDHRIIYLFCNHRFLRSSQIVTLTSGSPQQIIRRLQLLYHHGFLERPRAQLEYYHKGGSRSIVYGLGNKGAALLNHECGRRIYNPPSGEMNRGIGRIFLEHALLVSDFMVALELACQQHNPIRFVSEQELRVQIGSSQRFKWRVSVNHHLQLGIVPDRVFGLDLTGEDGAINRVVFFLEADRGTMPVTRADLSQTSFFRKLLAYEATWSQSIHMKRFGFDRIRVLTVTTTAERVKTLVVACTQLERGLGLFLFADRTILEKPGDILASIWQTGRAGQTTTLLD